MLPGGESTVPDPFWPLGRHMLRLLVSSPATSGRAQERIDSCVSRGGVVALAHPSWTGNLGTGRWRVKDLRAVFDFRLVEVRNLHSDEDLDTSIWHSVLVQRMPDDAVWAVAVDDARCASEAGQGWIEIKAQEITGDAFESPVGRKVLCHHRSAVRVWGLRISDLRSHRAPEHHQVHKQGRSRCPRPPAPVKQYAPVTGDGFVREGWWIRMGREHGRSRLQSFLAHPTET